MHGFEAFCETAHPRLVAALAHHFGDRWLAEELAQEALIRAGVHWTRVSRLEAPEGWAFRVGCNLGISVLRRRSVERRAMDRRPPSPEIHIDPDTPDRLALADALNRLPDKQRRAVIARHFLGLTAEQTARALGTTAGNVRVLTHRAMDQLRRDLGTTNEEIIDVR